MMDRYLLRYFLSVIDQGNFSRAAAACNVSQPTLSVGIAKLERQLGRELFRRTNRRIALTDAGARFAPHARRIEAEFLAAERSVEEAPALATLRLGVLTTLPSAMIEEMLVRLAGAPFRIELIEARARDLAERLARGALDAALTLVGDGQPGVPLFTEGYRLAMPEAHPLAARETVAAEELAGSAMLVRRQCEALSDTSRFFTARGVRPFFAARTTSDDRALALIRAGLGITVMPDCYAAPGIARPRLDGFTLSRTIGLAHASHLGPGDAVVGRLLRAIEGVERVKGIEPSS